MAAGVPINEARAHSSSAQPSSALQGSSCTQIKSKSLLEDQGAQDGPDRFPGSSPQGLHAAHTDAAEHPWTTPGPSKLLFLLPGMLVPQAVMAHSTPPWYLFNEVSLPPAPVSECTHTYVPTHTHTLSPFLCPDFVFCFLFSIYHQRCYWVGQKVRSGSSV